MYMDQRNMSNNQFQRNQYGLNQWNAQPNYQQQSYQPSQMQQQNIQYPQSANQSSQNISRPSYMRDERKGNLALTGELALGKNQNYQQVIGGRLNHTGNINADTSLYDMDSQRNRGYSNNQISNNYNQPVQQSQPYIRIQQQQQQQQLQQQQPQQYQYQQQQHQQQQQQQFGGGNKNLSANDITQAQNSLRLLKQKMQNKETTNYKQVIDDYNKPTNNKFGESSEKLHSQSTTNTSIPGKNNYRQVFKVDQQEDTNNIGKQQSTEFDDNEFAPLSQPVARQRVNIPQAQQSKSQNNQNSYNSRNTNGDVQQQNQDRSYGIGNKNNTNLIGSLNSQNNNNNNNKIKVEYKSSMQKTLEKNDPQMMYNAQRNNQMQNYQYTANQHNDDHDEDFQFASNQKTNKKPPLQARQQPEYGYQNSSSNNINSKKQFNSPNPIVSNTLSKPSLNNINNKSTQNIEKNYLNNNGIEETQGQKGVRAVSYRGEVNGQKYYNFSKNSDNSIEDEQENPSNQKFMSKAKLGSNQSNKKFNAKTTADEDIDDSIIRGYQPYNNKSDNLQPKNNKLNQLNKNKPQNDTLEAPIIPKQKINEPSKYDLSNLDHQQAVVQNDGDLEECPEGCGRRFAPESLEKHARICKKVFQKKRKQFDTKQQRIQNEEQEEILKRAEIEEKQKKQYQNKNKQQGNPKQQQQDKKSKWRIQSEQFRAVLKNNNGGEINEQPQYDDRVECSHCRRKFNEDAYKKHEPICGNRARIAKASGKPFNRK